MTIEDMLSLNEEIKEKLEDKYLSLRSELNCHIYITKIGIKDKCKKLGYAIRLFDLDNGVCFCQLNISKSAVLTQLEFVSAEDEENKLRVYGIDTDNNACSDYANNVKMNTDEMFNFLMQLIKIEQELIKEMEEKL
jgi:hypothetical protein